MPTANEKLLDLAIDHAIDLQKYSNGVVRQVLAVLNSLDKALRDRIAQALLDLPADSFTLERLDQLLASVRSANTEAIQRAYNTMPGHMRDLAGHEAAYQARKLEAVVPLEVRAYIRFNAVTAEQAYAAAFSRPFQGGLLKDWIKSADEGRMRAIRDKIRMGYVEGKTTDEIVRSIVGTRAARYQDGLLEQSRRAVETMTRTALSHTAATAREETYAANADIITAVRWVSVLDVRTSSPCRLRDGLRYTAEKEHRPIGHKVPWLQGPGRLHFRCRSVSAPVLKSLRELGIDVDGMGVGTRASMDGQVPADQTYSQWLARQSAARQDQILGPSRGRLIRQGGLSPNELYSPRGDLLTLAELAERDSAAFERAGL